MPRRTRDAIIRNSRPLDQTRLQDFDLSKIDIVFSKSVPFNQSTMATIERTVRQHNKALPEVNKQRAKFRMKTKHIITKIIAKYENNSIIKEIDL
jgi:hypothetical protein